jgi:hypothetical protein
VISKALELSQYALKFYVHAPRPEHQEALERLLLLNLNQNFSQLKSDFTKPLQMIKKYLQTSAQTS